jgi:hypothetical protein
MGYLLDQFGKEKLKRAYPDLNFDTEKSDASKMMGVSPDQLNTVGSVPAEEAPADSTYRIPTEVDFKDEIGKSKELDQMNQSLSDLPEYEAPGSQSKLYQAQQDRDSTYRNANLGESLGMIGQYLSRQDTNLASPMAQRSRERADDSVKKQKELVENEVNDPNSDISRVARERLKKAMPELKDQAGFENLTAAQLEKMFGKPTKAATPIVRSIFDPKTNTSSYQKYDEVTNSWIDTGKAQAYAPSVVEDKKTLEHKLIQRQTGSPAVDIPGLEDKGIGPIKVVDPTKEGQNKEESPEDKLAREAGELRLSLDPKQIEVVDKQNEAYLKDVSKNRDAISAAQGVRNILDAPKNGEMPKDILRSIQNQLARGSGEVGVTTENDVKPFAGGQDLTSRLKRWFSLNTVGQLPEEDRVFLKKYAEVMEKNARRGAEQQSRIYSQNISAATRLPLNQSAKLLGVDAASMKQPEKPKEEMVRMKNRNGVSGSLPKSKVKEYLQKGYSLVE